MNPPIRGRLQVVLLFILIGLAGFSETVRADIPKLAKEAENNAKITGLLKLLAKDAEARGDLFTCAFLAIEADRIATNTDLLKQQAVAEFDQLPLAQRPQVSAEKERTIADATITRDDANEIKHCLEKVRLIVAAFLLFVIVLFVWLVWRAFGPFRRREG